MHTLALLGACALAARTVAGFAFIVDESSVSECGQAQFNWTAGSPPYYITAISEFDIAVNHSIDDTSAWNDQGGSYQWTIPFDAGNQTVFIMSDSTGFATGGVSALIKVGARPTNAPDCALRTEAAPFYFEIKPDSDNIPQCSQVQFSFTKLAGDLVEPIYVTGVIPNGQVVQQAGSLSGLQWLANVAPGTNMLFSVWDSSGKQGGSSKLQTFVSGSDSCMSNPDSPPPSSTPNGFTQTGTNAPTGTSTRRAGVITVTSTALPAGAAGLTSGAIAGIVVGVLVAVLVLQFLLVWFCCRRQIENFLANRRQKIERRNNNGDVDLYEQRTNDYGEVDGPGMSLNVTGRPVRPFSTAQETEGTISPFLGGSESRSSYPPWDPNDRNDPFNAPSRRDPSIPSLSLHEGARESVLSSGDSLGHSPPLGTGAFSTVSGPGVAGVGAGPSTGQAPRLPSKLQLAMANPDNGLISEHGPPSAAPSGGFRRHEDAGSLGVANPDEPQVEDLPPIYNPQWESHSQR